MEVSVKEQTKENVYLESVVGLHVNGRSEKNDETVLKYTTFHESL